jgi:hypothetical protein
MRIEASELRLNSARIAISTSMTYEYLHKWDKNSDTTITASQEDMKAAATTTSIKNKINGSALENPIFHVVPGSICGKTSDDVMKELMNGALGDLRLQIIKDIIEIMTGKKIDILDPAEIAPQGDAAPAPASAEEKGQADSAAGPRTPQGWGVDYYFNETHYSREGTSFSASGGVKTADGRIVDFNITLEMSRESLDRRTVAIKAGDALLDPLMIDFSGLGVSFSEAKFEFDLTASGEGKLMAAPGAGCGFLAYDKNGNGIIDNGSELFGPSSGGGFNELAGLDCDGNGWIDENDAAFSSLKIWQKTADGSDIVSGLLEKDVGALYCGSAATLFDLTAGESRAMAGRLKETGVWLKESGGVGVLQEVDMVV